MTHAPRRIQRRRTKGWRMPPGAVYVGRASKWGNPFTRAWCQRGLSAIGILCDNATLVWLYEAWLTGRIIYQRGGWPPSPAEIRSELRGRDLVCWCPLDEPCHADVLLRLANAEGDA